MKTVSYQDKDGYWYKVLLPDDAPDSDASKGIVVGPPNMGKALGLPKSIARRFHNLLFERGILTAKDVEKNPSVVQGAILAAVGLNLSKVHEAFVSFEKDHG